MFTLFQSISLTENVGKTNTECVGWIKNPSFGKFKFLVKNTKLLHIDFIQGVPKNMGIQLRIGYRLCYELAL